MNLQIHTRVGVAFLLLLKVFLLAFLELRICSKQCVCCFYCSFVVISFESRIKNCISDVLCLINSHTNRGLGDSEV